MGQRSQIYFRCNDEQGKYRLVARYYQWNYGTRMVSRARGIFEWLEYMKEYPYYFIGISRNENITKLERIMDTNFDYRDVVLGQNILEKYENGYCDKEDIFYRDNNDGKLLIDMVVDWTRKNKKGDNPVKFKYAFVDWDSKLIGDGEQYMQWNENYGEDAPAWRDSKSIANEIKYTERNIRYIDKHAELMTQKEVDEYISHDYVADMGLKVKEEQNA